MSTKDTAPMQSSASLRPAAPRRQRLGSPQPAFTLLELVAVVATFAILAGMLLPVLARSGPDTRSLACRSNTRRLTQAWLAYAADNQDRLMSNPGWVARGYYMDWTSSEANTNASLLADPSVSLIAGYVRSTNLFKCPADSYQSEANPGPRVRSYSLNGVLGASSGPTVQGNGYPPVRYYYGYGSYGLGPARKMADLSTPGPAMVFVILDEHPDSINDATFMHDPGFSRGSERWRDLPGSLHNGACSLSFADGHSELHLWQETGTILPVSYSSAFKAPPYSLFAPLSKDYHWLEDRMPYRQQ